MKTIGELYIINCGKKIMQTVRAWLKHREPIEVLTFLFFVFVPLQTHYVFDIPVMQGGVWEFGVVRLYFMELVLVLLLAWYGMRGAWKAMSYRMRDLIIAMLLVFALWIFVPSGFTMRAFMTWLHVNSMLGVGVLAFWSARRYSARLVIVGFVTGMMLSALLGAYQYSAQEVIANTWLGMSYHAPSVLGDSVIETDTGRVLRAYGPFPHPNIFGGYLVIALFSLVMLFRSLSVRGKQIALLCAALFSIGVIWTYSRSAWLAALWVVFFAALQFRKEKIVIPRRTAFFSALIVLVVLFMSLPQIFSRFGIAYTSHPLEQRSVDERIVSWQQALPIFYSHALLGVGIGRFTDAVQIADPGKPGYRYQPVHNSFLLALSEMGIVGVFLLVSFFYSLRKRFIFVYAMPFFIIAFFDHYFWSLYSGLLLFGFVFFLMCVDREKVIHMHALDSKNRKSNLEIIAVKLKWPWSHHRSVCGAVSKAS